MSSSYRIVPPIAVQSKANFFASLFAFVWATGAWGNTASRSTIIFIGLGLVAAGILMLISAVFIVTFIRFINK